jgi:hypothetical protein
MAIICFYAVASSCWVWFSYLYSSVTLNNTPLTYVPLCNCVLINHEVSIIHWTFTVINLFTTRHVSTMTWSSSGSYMCYAFYSASWYTVIIINAYHTARKSTWPNSVLCGEVVNMDFIKQLSYNEPFDVDMNNGNEIIQIFVFSVYLTTLPVT